MSLYATIKDRRKSWGVTGKASTERKHIENLNFAGGSKDNLVLPSAVQRSPRLHPSFWDVPTKNSHDYSAGDQALLTSIASYVPGIVARHFRQTDQPLTLPHKASWQAAILFADISGFTPLTESLASQGKRGIELLTEHLNNYFGKMIELIVGHGGDVVKFAGDALMSIFPANDEGDLAAVAQLTCQCALQLQSQLGKYEANGVCLTLHIGVSSGLVQGVHVGGYKGKVEFILAGLPLEHVGDCEKAADSGEVYISHHTASLLGNNCELSTKIVPSASRGHRTGLGRFVVERNAKKGARVQKIRSIAEQPLELYRLDRILVDHPLPTVFHYGKMYFADMEKHLSQYIQEVVLEHVRSGAPDSFLTQLRRVSVIFVMLDLAYDEKKIPRIQEAMCAMQQAVYHYDGTVRQFIIDDKGSVFIAVFGLPPRCHEDDPSRAVQSCQMLQKDLAALEIGTSIGITTGDVFSGAVGCSSRREYAVVGDLVNLSARLMVAAKGLILVEIRTQAACPDISFKDLGVITVKGKTIPIEIYTPQTKKVKRNQEKVESGADSSGGHEPTLKPLYGREAELEMLNECLERVKDQFSRSADRRRQQATKDPGLPVTIRAASINITYADETPASPVSLLKSPQKPTRITRKRSMSESAAFIDEDASEDEECTGTLAPLPVVQRSDARKTKPSIAIVEATSGSSDQGEDLAPTPRSSLQPRKKNSGSSSPEPSRTSSQPKPRFHKDSTDMDKSKTSDSGADKSQESPATQRRSVGSLATPAFERVERPSAASSDGETHSPQPKKAHARHKSHDAGNPSRPALRRSVELPRTKFLDEDTTEDSAGGSETPKSHDDHPPKKTLLKRSHAKAGDANRRSVPIKLSASKEEETTTPDRPPEHNNKKKIRNKVSVMTQQNQIESVHTELQKTRSAKKIRAASVFPETIIIEGPAGIGKTHLINKVREMAAGHELTARVGFSYQVEKTTQYFAWRSIFEEIIFGTTRCNQEEFIVSTVQSLAPEYSELLPLLNPILTDIEFPHNEHTRVLTGSHRTLKTNDFLVELLRNSNTHVIILDNAQWIDSCSYNLALQVAEELENVLLIISLRSNEQAFNKTSFLELKSCKHLVLNPLNETQIANFVCEKLKVEKIGQKFTPYLLQVCQGNPFMLSELLDQLQATGRIKVVGDKWADLRQESFMLSSGQDSFRAIETTTATLRTLITSKLDRLDPKISILLKFAVVIGRVFLVNTLSALLSDIPRGDLRDYLSELENQSIIVLHSKVPLAYEFFQMAINEVVYETMAYSTRRDIHRKVAYWYKDNTPLSGLAAIYPLLAHHFRLGEETEHAIYFLWAAGDQAFKNGQFTEAAKFYSRILALTGDDLKSMLTPPPTTDKKAAGKTVRGHLEVRIIEPSTLWKGIHLRRCLAQALNAIGQITKAKSLLLEALELMGSPIAIHQNKTLMKEVGFYKKENKKATPDVIDQRRTVERDFDSKAQTNEHLQIMLSLANIFFYCCQLDEQTYCAMKALQLAISINASQEICIAYAECAVALGLSGSSNLAQKMFSNANYLASLEADPAVEGQIALQRGIFNITIGNWLVAKQNFKTADCCFLTCGNVRKSQEANLSLAWIELLLDNHDVANAITTEVGSAAYKKQDTQLLLQSVILKPLDSKITENTSKLIDTVDHSKLDPISRCNFFLLQALAKANAGQISEAFDLAEQVNEILLTISASTYWIYSVASQLPAVYEKAWKLFKTQTEVSRELEMKVELRYKQCLAFLQKFSTIFPFGGARLHLWKAIEAFEDKKLGKAETYIKTSIANAKKYQVPAEEILAYSRRSVRSDLQEMLSLGGEDRDFFLSQTTTN